MARIRTIKPEFWDSPSTARASLRARLFFIAMWNWADDYGIGTANAKQLVGFAFPNDDEMTVADYPRLRAEVSDCFGVQFYEVAGRPYFAIPTWDDHQRTEKRAQRRNPLPSEGIPTVTDSPTIVADLPALEQGNRGTGEVGTGEQGNSDYVGGGKPPARRDGSATQIIIGEWLASLPKRPPKDVIGQVSTKVASLLKEGIDHADVTAGLAAWQSKGLHPNTLPSVVAEVMNRPARAAPSARPSTTDQRFADAVALSQELAAKENS